MKRKMEVSELIFKIISYFLLIVFALMCVYPFIYALSSSFSSKSAVDGGDVILWPVGFQTEAYRYIFTRNAFWISYANTLFLAFIGTIWCLVYTILGAYALSKKRLMGRHAFNFFLVFTMWFSAGIVPQFVNFTKTGDILAAIAGTSYSNIDQKWLIIIAMGMNATNVILLRNAFEGVPSEIEEAARIDGGGEFKILFSIVLPLSKPMVVTISLMAGLGYWNDWTNSLYYITNESLFSIQGMLNTIMTNIQFLANSPSGVGTAITLPSAGVRMAIAVIGVVPILCIYPFFQKYFVKGIVVGGVKG